MREALRGLPRQKRQPLRSLRRVRQLERLRRFRPTRKLSKPLAFAQTPALRPRALPQLVSLLKLRSAFSSPFNILRAILNTLLSRSDLDAESPTGISTSIRG